jgi:repressor LexA
MTAAKSEPESPGGASQEITGLTRVPNESVPGDLALGENRVTFRATSDALAEEGIREGDLLLVEADATPADGQTVVAVWNGKAILRRLYQDENGRLRLEAQSRNQPPVLAEAADVAIRGRVVAVIRKYPNTNP